MVGGLLRNLLLLLIVLYSFSVDAVSGGLPTSLKSHPWQLKITGCGAVLISSSHALTAAHCVVGLNANEIQVLGGGTGNLDDLSPLAPLKKILIHPEYKGWSGGINSIKKADIAILFFKEELSLSETLYPISLPDFNYNLSHSIDLDPHNFFLTGWGNSDFSQEDLRQLKVLKHLEVMRPFNSDYWINNDELVEINNERYNFSGAFETGHYLSIRARFGQACKGDSGGPLVDNNENVLIGLSAHAGGLGCGFDKYFFYTDVHSFVGWIHLAILP